MWIDGQPAARADVLLGDEIIAVDDVAFSAIDAFCGKMGRPSQYRSVGIASRPVFGLSVVPRALHPNERFLRSMEASARIIRSSHGARIDYVHVWSCAG